MRISPSSISKTLCCGFDGVNYAGVAPRLSFPHEYGINEIAMEKIDPQPDHLKLNRFNPGQLVRFQGKPYTIQRRTTLASGEAAVVLQGDKEQFVIGASRFLAGIS
jgi:hypothetical protein